MINLSVFEVTYLRSTHLANFNLLNTREVCLCIVIIMYIQHVSGSLCPLIDISLFQELASHIDLDSQYPLNIVPMN
jgi:hypothetical protein